MFLQNSTLIRRFLWRGSLFYYVRTFVRCKRYPNVTHCIFDLDGTILNNQCFMDSGFKHVFDKLGHEYTPDWRLRLMGRTGRDMWEIVIRGLKLKVDWKELYAEYTKAIADTLEDAPLMPGVAKLITHLQHHHVPMAVATSSRRVSYEKKTSHISGLMSNFSLVVCGGDDPQIGESKPSGLIYTVTASRFQKKASPNACLVFEDSPIGVTAAKNADMQVVGIPCPPTPPKALAHADEVLKTLEEFCPGKYGLPPYPKPIEPSSY